MVHAPQSDKLRDSSGISQCNTCETMDYGSSPNDFGLNEMDSDIKLPLLTRIFSRQTHHNNSSNGDFHPDSLGSNGLFSQNTGKINVSSVLVKQDMKWNSQLARPVLELFTTPSMSRELDTPSETQKLLPYTAENITNVEVKRNSDKARGITNEDSGMESCSIDSHLKSLYLYCDVKKNDSKKSSPGLELKSITSENVYGKTIPLINLVYPRKKKITESAQITEINSSPSIMPKCSLNRNQVEPVLPFYEEWLYDKNKQNLSGDSTYSISNYRKLSGEQRRVQPLVAVAKMTYSQKYPHELNVSEGERLLILNRVSAPRNIIEGRSSSLTKDEDFWLVERIELKHMSNHCSRKGLVPGEYLQIIGDSLTTHISWFDIDRNEAERLLLLMGNPSGTYIIRPSSVNADGIACCLTTPYPKNYEPPTKLSLLEVNRNNFGFIKKLGQGSFGEVWYGTWNNQMPVAIKKLLGNGNMNHARFLNEAELMHRLNHPNVVRILAVCTLPTNEPTYIISELMENGSLKQYMQKLNPVDIRMKNLLEMMKDVVGGMVHLEEQHYVHRDLRASNILVDSKNRLKVADFGLAHLLSDSDEYIGTLEFTVNEVKVRVCSGYRLPRPILKISFTETLLPVDDEYEVPKRKSVETFMCPINIYNKLLECWNISPDKRPSFNSLYSFIEELLEKEIKKDISTK
ncbi:fyn-related kinase [Schistosoma bovis]|uniref:non-specific protein-tyrosine kinase n=1 Tax=Schistosoma bovis TaxID=6184 RepID=A0A430QK15_SCHBO|nr:fyn-related kinase [Schistosoma bovis]